ANSGIGVADGAILEFLRLKEVWVNGPRTDSVLPFKVTDGGSVRNPVREVPFHVKRQGGARAGQRVHLSGIGELVSDTGSRFRLEILSEPGARVGKSPRRQLDLKRIKGLADLLNFILHNSTPHGITI